VLRVFGSGIVAALETHIVRSSILPLVANLILPLMLRVCSA